MNYKLGDRVRFDRELVKFGARHFLQREELWAEFKHDKPLEGIVCGKRRIARYGELGHDFTLFSEEYQQVYLVATDLRGFHRVPEEWLEPVSDWEEIAEECRKLNVPHEEIEATKKRVRKALAIVKAHEIRWAGGTELTEEDERFLYDIMTGKVKDDEN